MTRTLIGTGVTDSNGVAKLSKDPNNQDIDGYVGTGAGEIDFVASVTVDGNTIYSTPYYVNDVPATPSVSLSLSSDSVTVGSSVTLTATVLDESHEPLESASVVFKKGDTTLSTETTDSNGEATYSYTTDTVGELSISATYDSDYSDSKTLTVNKHTSTISTQYSYPHDGAIYIGDTVTLSGTLSIDDVGTSGLSVKIYKDGSLLEEVTTISGGTFSKSTTFSSSGTHTMYAVYEGSSVNSSVTGTPHSISVSKIPTSLSITVPQLVYSDTFSITGVLKDDIPDTTHNPINNASVKLYMKTSGTTTLEATGTTNSSGEVTFSRQAPTTITDYDFWLVYEGDPTYGNDDSSTESRRVGQETSVLTITSPSNNASYSTGSTVSVTGTLLSNDGEAMASKSVVVKESSTTLATLTTDSNGAFTGSLSSLASGSHTLSIEFAGDTYYTSVTGSRTISLSSVTPSSVSLTSNKSVLSYADSESATLTATVTGSDTNPYTGATVEIYSGSTKLGNATDNNDGTYTYTLASTGAGDLSLTAKVGSLESSSVSVEDCYHYDTASSNKTSSYSSPIVYRGSGSGQLNYNSSNGYYGTISGSNEVMIPLSEITGKNNITIEFDALFNANISGSSYYGIAGICAYEDNNNYSRLSCHNLKIAQRVCVNGSASETEDNLTNSVSRGDLLHFKFTISDNQIVELVTRSTTTIATRTISYTPTSSTKYGIAFVWSNDWVKDTYLKNIKIKPLFTLSSNKSVLSYADSDTCTLTATHPLGSGKTVNLYKSSDNSLIGAMTDNNDGTYSYTYSSQGVGDIGFYASDGSLASETFSLEDCHLYFTDEHSQTGSSTSEIISGFTFPNSSKWVWEYDMKKTSSSTIPMICNSSNMDIRTGMGSNGSSAITIELNYIGQGAWITNLGNMSNNTYYTFKIERDEDYMKYYVNGVLKQTIDAKTPLNTSAIPISDILTWELHWRNWGSGTTTIKNLKIKPL